MEAAPRMRLSFAITSTVSNKIGTSMKYHSFKILVCSTSLVAVGVLHGVSADPVSVNQRPRMQSMGGAGVAARGDKDSAMMNPAGLNDVVSPEIQALPILVEIPFDIGLMNSYLDYKDSIDKDGATKTEKSAALEKLLGDVASEATAMRVNLYPSYTRKNMHVGLMMDMLVNPRMRVGGLTSNQLVELGGSAGTVGLILGGSYPFMNDQLQVGATLKPLYRIGITAEQNQTFHDVVLGLNESTGGSVADELFGKNKGDKKALGIGLDLGVKYWIPYLPQLKPSVGLTYQDVGNTRFWTDKGIPADIPQSVSAGVAIHPDWGITKNTIALDFRNINEQQAFMNHVHLGVESMFWQLFALRAGLAQGYITGGIGFDLWYIQFDAYVTAEEAGRKAHIQDQRTLGFRLSAVF